VCAFARTLSLTRSIMRAVCPTLIIVVLALSQAVDASVLRGRDTTAVLIPEYQQLNVNGDGRVSGGSCINFESARIKSAGTDGIYSEDLGVEGCKEKCEDEKGCIQFMVCVGSGSCTPGSCGLLKHACNMHPHAGSWDVYRIIPLEKCEEAVSDGSAGSDFVCPFEFPIGQGKDAEVQEHYFTKLHCSLINGNGYLPGAGDHTFHERWVQYYGKELKCLYGLFLDDKQKGGPCGGLKSQQDDRQKKWEQTCLDARTSQKDVMDMMDDKEQAYYRSKKKVMMTTQAYATYVDLNGEKELICMQMKLVDDECGAFKSPRLLSPGSAAKLLKKKKKDPKGLEDPMADFGK